MSNIKAQSILEYAVLTGIIMGVLSVMQVYFQRGIQAVVKVAADEVGRQEDAEEIDPLKGQHTESRVRRMASGAPVATGDLSAGVSERRRVSQDGSIIRDVYSVSSVAPYCDDSGSCTDYSYNKYESIN